MLKKLNLLLISAAMILAFNSSATAGTAYAEDFQAWGNVTARGNFGTLGNSKALWWLEGQGRLGADASRFAQGIIRPGVGYALTEKTSIWLGYAWIPTSRPFAARHPFNEHRIWQQLLYNNTFSFGTLQSRTRLEQRFFDIPGSTDVHHRFRQLFKLAIPIAEVPNLSFVVANEIFMNFNDVDMGFQSGFDQNRLFGGFAYRFNPTVTTEIGYMNQYLNRRNTTRLDSMQHILAVTVSLNFK